VNRIVMTETDGKRAHLLMENHENIDDFRKLILESPYTAMDLDTPTLRFRGTLVDARNGAGGLRIIGWQRNVSRLRKLDVSLPTIITLTLNGNGRIENVELDRSFKGSKGLMCCHAYLNRNMKAQLEGGIFDSAFFHRVKQEKTHCSHLFEVLSGMYSYYQILKENDFKEIQPEGYACEEEAIDSYIEDGTLHSLGTHALKGKAPIHFRLVLHDVLSKVGFDKNGIFKMYRGVEADFFLNEKHLLSGTVSIHGSKTGHTDLSKFLFKCIDLLKSELCSGKAIRIFNTNLYPRACIGMLIQAVAIRLFNNNYSYIMHTLTALQRSSDAPLCVGALADQNEADRHFPGFDFSELV
jgi:hypothetical protein